MGFSVSASTAIIFAGLFLAVGVLYPAVSNGYERVTDAEIDRDDAQLDMRNTEINITDISSMEITVRNEGSTSLDADEIDLLDNGDYQRRTDSSYTVTNVNSSGSNLWLPGESLQIQYNSDSGDQLKIVTDYGISVTEEVP
jgi:flagellar protein FlaF